MVRYQVKIHDDSGNLLFILRDIDISRLEMTVAENEIGELTVEMPADVLKFSALKYCDYILTVERDLGAGFMVECGPGAERGFFLRDIVYSTDGQGIDRFALRAYDGNYLLDSRVVAYTAESNYTKRTDQADDMCLLIVNENLGSAATDAARRLSRLTVETGNGDGVLLTKSYARANVLNMLKSICDESWEEGSYLVFDTVYTAPGRFEFRVYIGARGVNMGSSQTNRRIVRPYPCEVTYSRKDERNFIYAGGKGEKEGRGVQTATNAEWAGASIWNRREDFINAANADDDASVLAAARTALYKSRPRWLISGTLEDREGQRYGVDYHFGDIVVAQYRDISMDVHISAVNLVYEAGKETVSVTMRSETE